MIKYNRIFFEVTIFQHSPLTRRVFFWLQQHQLKEQGERASSTTSRWYIYRSSKVFFNIINNWNNYWYIFNIFNTGISSSTVLSLHLLQHSITQSSTAITSSSWSFDQQHHHSNITCNTHDPITGWSIPLTLGLKSKDDTILNHSASPFSYWMWPRTNRRIYHHRASPISYWMQPRIIIGFTTTEPVLFHIGCDLE
jgi:hypothetical protein